MVMTSPAQGKVITNLGAAGMTYPVVEPGMLADVQKQVLQNKEVREQWVERIKSYQPADLQKLPRAVTDRTYTVDMTYTLNSDLTDANGKITYPSGYSFNPLDYINLPGGIVVIDGDNPDEVEWFKQSPYADNHQIKLLISDGLALDLIDTLQRPVFYLTEDMASRLQLKAVPALIFQQGNRMLVREIKLAREQEAQ